MRIDVLATVAVAVGLWHPLPASALEAGQTPPTVQQVPGALPPEDPEVLAKRERLKELKRREYQETDPARKVALLDQIVDLSIDLEEDYSPFEAKKKEQQAAIDKQASNLKLVEDRRESNLKFNRAAREALEASPVRLKEAIAAHTNAYAADSRNPETLQIGLEIRNLQQRALYWNISVVALVALAAAALGVPLVRALMGAGKTRQLEMIEGPDPGEVFDLKKEKTSVGAIASEADIVITDPFRKISRRHCEIVRSNGRYFLTDCSTNGTLINGKAAPRGEPVLLKKGDRIALADDVILRFK